METGIQLKKVIRQAIYAGLIAACLNLFWYWVIEKKYSITGLPKGFLVAIAISSILPILVGGLGYFAMLKFVPKGEMLFLIIGIAFLVFSIFPSFETNMPDGTKAPEHFALLTVPMHFIAGIVGLFMIIKKSK